MAAVFDKTGYVFQDACEISQYIVIPVAQDDDAVFVEPLRAPNVCPLAVNGIVLSSVDLDREQDRRTIEIENIVSDSMLTPELQSIELTAA